LIFRRKSVEAPPEIQELVITGLRWDLETGSISYRFTVRPSPVMDEFVVSVNPKLDYAEVETAGKYRVRTVVEGDLRWARLRTLRVRGASGSISASVTGAPEDFTLSRLGVRYKRAYLKDELVWHPIIGDRLATWGTRGHIRRYKVNVAMDRAIGPGEITDEPEGLTFEGEPRLRNPGITIIGGLGLYGRRDWLIAVPQNVEPDIGYSALEAVRELVDSVSTGLEADIPEYTSIALIWNDVDPVAYDNLIGLRAAVGKALVKRNPLALHETLHLVSVHIVYNSPLTSLSDYWLYETLPQALALYAMKKIGSSEALTHALTRLAECLEAVGGYDSVPGPARVTMPKSKRHHASISCKGPLLLWREVGEKSGYEDLASLIDCVINRGVTSGNMRQCSEEVLGEKAADNLQRLMSS